MSSATIPTCYFPSTILTLGCVYSEHTQEFLHKYASSSQEAIEILENRKFDYNSLQYICNADYALAQEMTHQHALFNQKFAALHAELYNPHRFLELSVVVIDDEIYALEGLTLCDYLVGSSLKKMLLVAVGNEEFAQELLDKKIIDAFVVKEEKYLELLKLTILKLQKQYFQDMSDRIHRMLKIPQPKYLKEVLFIDLFTKVCQEHSVVEYYLLDNLGSFIILNAAGNIQVFMTTYDKDQAMQWQLADNQLHVHNNYYYTVVLLEQISVTLRQSIFPYALFCEELSLDAKFKSIQKSEPLLLNS